MAFDKAKYDIEYKKKNKKQFKVELNLDEMDELNKLLKKYNLTKIQFVRNAIIDLKQKKNKD